MSNDNNHDPKPGGESREDAASVAGGGSTTTGGSSASACASAVTVSAGAAMETATVPSYLEEEGQVNANEDSPTASMGGEGVSSSSDESARNRDDETRTKQEARAQQGSEGGTCNAASSALPSKNPPPDTTSTATNIPVLVRHETTSTTDAIVSTTTGSGGSSTGPAAAASAAAASGAASSSSSSRPQPPESGFAILSQRGLDTSAISNIPGAFHVMPLRAAAASSASADRDGPQQPSSVGASDGGRSNHARGTGRTLRRHGSARLTEHPSTSNVSGSGVSEITHDDTAMSSRGIGSERQDSRRGSNGGNTINTANIDVEVVEARLVEEGRNDTGEQTGSDGSEGDATANDASLVIHAVRESKYIRRFHLCGRERSINLLSTAALFVLFLGMIVAVSVASSRRSQPGPAPKILTRERALEIVKNISDPALLDDPTSSQGRALHWLVEEDEFYVSPSNERKVLQRYVLATLHFAANGDGHHYNGRPFVGPGDECDWTRTLCETAEEAEANNPGQNDGKDDADSFRAIRQVDLSYAGLNGTMPEEVGELKEMAFLYYSGNSFHSSIPTTLGRLSKLKQLAITENQFSSSVPTELGNLQQLTLLVLAKNEFTGTIPLELANMRRLYWVFLDKNHFTGSLDHLCDLYTSYLISDCLSDNLTCSCCDYCG